MTSPLNITLLPSPTFHPHLLITPPKPPHSSCDLQLSLLFPDEIFVDPSELSDLWGYPSSSSPSPPQSTNSVGWSLNPQVVDIERPTIFSLPILPTHQNHVDINPSIPLTMLGLELRISGARKQLLDIPLHARYLEPSEEGKKVVQLFTDPKHVSVEWICPKESNILEHLEIHLDPIFVVLPTGRPQDRVAITLITTLVIWLSWTWLVYKIIMTRRRLVSKVKVN
ncbi:hypothetical protein M231_07878 [Tremella mesenterica]|uniref:Protein PBN1 n=1 Tax=Tremella mesenterica TaxID=5217 RepID=A0A4V1M2X2_TREME|nr:hypothetical protein M231_07878 [Tremella mesenterica]